ncbi:MAG: hypothetical protein ABIG44_14585 [Planctomycetota bacterium]
MSDERVPRRMEMVLLGFRVVEVVTGYAQHSRAFYYQAMLSGHECPRCAGRLAMAAEGRCRCESCGDVFDPTLAFQNCPACGGAPRIRVRRYECSRCRSEVVSRFLFDGLVFDAAYFRQRMAEHRQRKHEQRERIREMLAESRSPALPAAPVDLEALPGLLAALDKLTAGSTGHVWSPQGTPFDLKRYEAHVQAYVGTIAVNLEHVPPLSEDTRLDRIWRFIAIIFLTHAGWLDAWQDSQAIMVRKREIDAEGPGFPGELENADGIERPVGRVET